MMEEGACGIEEGMCVIHEGVCKTEETVYEGVCIMYDQSLKREYVTVIQERVCMI